MKKLILVIILLAIIGFTVGGYFFILHFDRPNAVTPPSPTTNTQTPTTSVSQSQATLCEQSQLSADLSSQGAAGNIYATLELTNTGKTSCTVVLGNTVTAIFNAKNIVARYVQTLSIENFMLAPSEKVYSQIHYPNGPQCQSGNTQKPITFIYKTEKTSVVFVPYEHTGKLVVQACLSPTEKTIVDIWPLSKSPITP